MPSHLGYVAVYRCDNLLHLDAVALAELLGRLPESTCDVRDRLQEIGVRLK